MKNGKSNRLPLWKQSALAGCLNAVQRTGFKPMCEVLLSITLLSLSFVSMAAAATPSGLKGSVDFQREVRPILADKCFACHGPDPSSRMAELRLDTQEGAFAERDNGSPVTPGNPQTSLLVQRITSEDPVRRMPPEYSNKQLTAEEIRILERWIEQGAPWDLHWSFKSIERPELPAVENKEWVRNPIDRFILARLEAEGLTPNPEADLRSLARRASLDLTGLPPTPEQVDELLGDRSENAYEKYVKRLLASPHWGEHRARYWLDAARYGDTHGLHLDNYREMWPYRDWVINAFNGNMPFDEFTVEQIAGDLLPNATLEQRIASGFHRNNVTTNEAGVIVEEIDALYANDRADTTGMVWLGLTVGCAACHDHKFDPISQRDFYSLTAFFRNTTQDVMDGNVADSAPIAIVPGHADLPAWRELQEREQELNRKRQRMASAASEDFEKWLATGRYRSLESPLKRSWETLSLELGEKARVRKGAEIIDTKLEGGAMVGEGPEPGRAALRFEEDSWVELPGAGIDEAKPFSITIWAMHPNTEGSFVFASRTDPSQGGAGWSLDVGSRVSGFRMLAGDSTSPEDESKPEGIEIRAGHLEQMEPGGWNHIAVSYDGSGERAGLAYYLNGKAIPTQGSEYFTRLEGTIFNDRPILLGKRPGKGDAPDQFLAGGAIAEFRIFDRAISAEQAELVALWPALQSASRKGPGAFTDLERSALRLYYLNVESGAYQQLSADGSTIERERREIRRRGGVTHVMRERAESAPMAHVLARGAYDQPRDEVPANTPAALPPLPASAPHNRLGLARWLVDVSNPLPARVAVNRFWQQVFGRGIVRSAGDFGAQGEPPSNPQLLDFLASEFHGDWDVKNFFRLLVTSATYRQSALTTAEKAQADPDNSLLSRGPRFRMDGEMVRDYALASSGILVPKIGGPSVKPYQPAGVWESVAMIVSNTRHYERGSGEDLYRRSLYTFWKRSAPPASMAIFDAPSREHATVQRERTNTPLQALVSMNDVQLLEAARFLSERAMREGGSGLDPRLDFIAERVLVRRFDEDERSVARQAYETSLEFYTANPNEAAAFVSVGESKADETLPVQELAALTLLTNQLLSLDEALNK